MYEVCQFLITVSFTAAGGAPPSAQYKADASSMTPSNVALIRIAPKTILILVSPFAGRFRDSAVVASAMIFLSQWVALPRYLVTVAAFTSASLGHPSATVATVI